MNIAVNEFKGEGVDSSTAKIITDRVRSELFKTKAFTVIERDEMNQILKEQGFQQTGCVSDACAVEVGQLLGIQQMIAGSIGKVGSTYTINARIIDVSTGKVIRFANIDCMCPIDHVLTQSTAKVALQLSGAILENESGGTGEDNNFLIKKEPPAGINPQDNAAMGAFYYSQKNYQEAFNYFQKWYLHEGNAKAAEAMAMSAMRLKLYDKARHAAEWAVSLDSNVLESRKILSVLYLNDKDWARAAVQLEVIVAKIKFDVGLWKKLARCYEELNARDKVVIAAAHIVDLDKKDVPSRRRMVENYLEKKDYASALTLLKELAILTPEDAKVFRHLYQISLEKDQKKDAILYLRNFLMLDSSDAFSYKVQGDLLYEQKNISGANESYQKAIKLDPDIYQKIDKNRISITR